MTVPVNPPPQLRIPEKYLRDSEVRGFFEKQRTILFQLWKRTGGSTDSVSAYSDHENLSNIGENTHSQIDTHIGDVATHIDWTSDNSPTVIDPANYTDTNDHEDLSNKGVNSHGVIDSHIANETVHIKTATTAELNSLTHDINTNAAKVLGYSVLNTTTGVTVFASGNADNSVWHYYDSTTAHTPV